VEKNKNKFKYSISKKERSVQESRALPRMRKGSQGGWVKKGRVQGQLCCRYASSAGKSGGGIVFLMVAIKAKLRVEPIARPDRELKAKASSKSDFRKKGGLWGRRGRKDQICKTQEERWGAHAAAKRISSNV